MKIGIVNDVKYNGRGTRNVIYRDPDFDGYMFVSEMQVIIYDNEKDTLKSIKPKYNHSEHYLLGNIVLYDEESNSIEGTFYDFSQKQKDELLIIRQKIVERLAILKKEKNDSLESLTEQLNLQIIINSIDGTIKLWKLFYNKGYSIGDIIKKGRSK